MQARQRPQDPWAARTRCRGATFGSAIRARDRAGQLTRMCAPTLLPPSMLRTAELEVPEGARPQGGNVVGAGAPARLGHLSCSHSRGADVTGCAAGKSANLEARGKDSKHREHLGPFREGRSPPAWARRVSDRLLELSDPDLHLSMALPFVPRASAPRGDRCPVSPSS